ncbi:MAG: ATP-binding protein [Gallionellaceae bacterium]|jgi:hypothetical protein
MSENIKNTAITAAGYIYQNRQGLKVLCDWLDAPTRYSRVKFECDDETIAPTGLDDIVVERSDGLVDLQQVKFTPNPDAHLLSWDWMLEKAGKTARSRSMLRKWFDAFKKLEPARMGEISLTTNRRPDAAIEACLDAGRISFAKIPEPKRSEVIAELGSAADCEEFFSQLRIRHSDKGYVTLEHEVDARLRMHGTPEGIAILKNVALNWATQRNVPAPDGWIMLAEVRAILRASPPAPLPEDFVIPKGYEVPDATFHKEFVRDVIGAAGNVIVLTGPPGRGKSTYLSALCDTLAEQDIPTVRHHYFLSTTERGRDRVNSYVVEQSIRAQVKQLGDDVPVAVGGLRALLEACASHYKGLSKPFVLILDGLDHVWRTNAKDKQPLEDLFSQVIPCPDNMVLLVGTQPVDDAQLPTDLLAVAPKAGWHTLPAMSENAVLSYLRKAVQEGRLTTGLEGEGQAEEQLQGAASALRARTNGHPLHVVYATAELEHAARKLSPWDVQQLKGDLSKDAKFYYASLWEDLLPSLKDTLRLVCAFPFFWPRTAFAEIAAVIKAAEPQVGSVEHLLHSSAAGLKIFHESLAVFVRATADYEDRIKELMPAVANWLESSAPTSLRVNWLWTVQAKLGNPKNLITGLTRDWVMLRLEEGYPESLFDTLLSEAMVAALETTQFADAYRLEHLKARMVGGSEFQMQNDDLAKLISFTLTLATEEGVVREAIASRHETDILRVAALGLALRDRGDQALAEMCGEEVLRRFRGLNRFSGSYASSTRSDEFKFLAGAFARLGTIGATPTALARLVDKNGPAVWLPRVQMLVDEGSLDDLMRVVAPLASGERKNIISDACIRADAKARVSIAERDDFNALARTPCVAAVGAALTRSSKPLNEPIPVEWLKGDYYERKEDLSALAHHWFFSAVHLGLCMAAEDQTAFEYARAPIYKDRENITDFLDALSAVGAQVAHHWWRGEFVDFHELFALLEPLEFRRFRQSHDWSSAAEDFRRALHRIACDIRLGSILLDNIDDVALTEETMDMARQCKWFDGASFRAQYAAGSLTRMSDEAAASFVQSQRSLLDAEVWEETCERLQTPLQLCAIALAHNLTLEAHQLCRQTWELTTGYGHRKDPTLANTVDAIGYLVDVAAEDARRLLGRVAPQIHHVLKYTDGKGTRHVLSEADRLLAKLKPLALVVKYEEHTHAGDWWQAENSLRAYVEQGVKEGWPLDALMRTGLHPEIRDILQQLAQDGSASAAERLRVLQEHGGWDVGFLQRKEHSGSGIDSKPYEGDVTTFEPEQLDDLVESLSGSYDERPRLLRAWYQHWVTKGQGRRLLEALDGLLLSEEGRRRDVLLLSDLAFHTRRKLSGANAAWKYLVRAQILSGGWIGYMESETKTRSRLDLIAEYYPQRCDEFVAQTTYGMFDAPVPPRVAPTDVMVYFYVRQGRIAEAVRFAETMVNCVIEDTRTLPLEQPCWAAELVSPSMSVGLMDDLSILIARLGWPSTSARWWTMQELAARLGEPTAMAKTESALLQLLRSRKLEAEVVEVLFIFWMAVQGHGYSPAAELAENILKPSLLSELLVDSFDLAAQAIDEGLTEVPDGFEVPDDFNGVQGADLPRAFRTSMSKLEAYSGLPFVKQMAFEWAENRAAYPDAPYQGDPWHFTRPLGNGVIGQLSARAALRAISAYLRALAVAEQFWNMPLEFADKKSLLALPVHPALALLRPQRSAWFPTLTDFDGDTEAAFRALIARVEVARPGDELIAFNSPVVVSMERCVEVSLVRWSQAAGGNIDDADLAAHLEAFWMREQMCSSAVVEPLSTTIIVVPPTLEQLVDGDCKAWPLAGALDYDRMGYLQHDLYPSRLFFPTVPGLHEVEITPRDGQLEVKVEDQAIADFYYWNAGWGPARPRSLRGNCGTALISRGTVYREGACADSGPLRAFYFWQVRTLHRSNSFDEFSETLTNGAMFV